MSALPEIRIVVAEPHKPAVVKMVSDTLEALQKEIGGNLELYRLHALRLKGIHCYINEDGIQLNLEPNLALRGDGFILGNIIASKADAAGKELGLTEREALFARVSLDVLRGLKP